VWTTRASVVAATLGLAAATHLARRPRIGARARRLMIAAYVASGIVAWPTLLAWQGRGTAELLVIDVGQGDAIAVRSPRGRWLLVDTGTEGRGSDPGEHPVVRALRARGVRRLEALVLTHAHLDHIGGAQAVLASFDVGAVYDPSQAAPSGEFFEVLEAAERLGIPWRAARAGGRLDLDGLQVTFLWPVATAASDLDPNETSVVLRVSYGEWDALLTGDQYKAVERSLADELADIEVLKVGHHGSDTSTDSLLVERAQPELALVSVGRGNRYGHPDPDVLARLEGSGARVLRTDLEGSITVLARPEGASTVSTERSRR
jgi:competence protein ComEC